MLYQPSNKIISELPLIPKIKVTEEEEEKQSNTHPSLQEYSENNENELNEINEKESADINNIKFKISNPNFRNSFLELWKKQELNKEQQRTDMINQLHFELQRKDDSFIFDLSEQSLVKLENSRQELIRKIKEINGEKNNDEIKDVYDPEHVDSIIQNSELLKDQYFSQLQKHVEEIITTNIQHINERIETVNSELEKLKISVDEKNNPSNKKGTNKKDDKKEEKSSKNKKDDNKSKQKQKSKKK